MANPALDSVCQNSFFDPNDKVCMPITRDYINRAWTRYDKNTTYGYKRKTDCVALLVTRGTHSVIVIIHIPSFFIHDIIYHSIFTEELMVFRFPWYSYWNIMMITGTTCEWAKEPMGTELISCLFMTWILKCLCWGVFMAVTSSPVTSY